MCYIKCNRCGKESDSYTDALDTFIRYSRYTAGSKKFRPMCKQCKKDTTIPTRNNGKDGYRERERETNRNRRANYYSANVLKIKEHLGGKIACSICNYEDECFAPFDFHHLDPSTKEFGIHKKIDMSPFESWKTEVDKCILVCSNCHRKIHSKRCTDVTAIT
jgi:hypothetical protein